MNRKSIFRALAATSLFLTAPALAQGTPGQVHVTAGINVEKVEVVDGIEQVVLKDMSVVVPGDKLLFSTRYANTGAEAVENFVITNPVPSAVRLTDESAAEATVSVDGGKTWGKLSSLTVKADAGESRAAQAGDITHVRWVVPSIAPKAEGTVQYHAIVR